MKWRWDEPGSSVLATSKDNSRVRSQQQKGKSCPIRWGDAADLYWVQRLDHHHTGGPKACAAGHPPQVDPQPKDKWRTGRLEGLVAAGAPAASRQPRRGGDCGFASAAQEGWALSPRSESDLLSTPFPPKNTFLAKSRRQEGDAAREATAWSLSGPSSPLPGSEDRRQGSALPGQGPLLGASHSTAVAAAIFFFFSSKIH